MRVGDDAWLLDRAVTPTWGKPHRGWDDVTASWSPALTTLLRLIQRHGGDGDFWADAIDRAVEVIADARRSYEEHALRRDPYLRDTLGLTHDQLAALGALLIGTRPNNRARHSLLLALHRDPGTSIDAVPRARERLAALLASPAARPALSA